MKTSRLTLEELIARYGRIEDIPIRKAWLQLTQKDWQRFYEAIAPIIAARWSDDPAELEVLRL